MTDIIGHGGGKGGDSHTHYEAPDSLHSTAYARVLDLVSEGEILGLAEGTQSIYLNGTPIANADGTTNFKNVNIDFRTGTQDQDYIAGFPDVENEVGVGVELKYGTPWVHAISNTELSAVRITLGVDQLYKADTDNGDIGGTTVAYMIELSTDGGAYHTVISSSFTGKTMSSYQRTARIDLPHATTGWQIRVTRLTPNATVVSIVDKTNVVSYTEVIDAKLRYPMSAIVGIQVDATQFQSVPTRAYDLYGRIVQVPSNYDAIRRTYTGAWDGTFKPSWSNNPAWVFRDLVLHDRYGLGNRIAVSQVDKWALYKIARYCDEMVPDGKGGTEPRFTCNLYLQSRKQAYAVLQDIASIFRGISYWGAGSIIASADMPSDPVYIYTAANVISGKFNRTGSKKSTRYTVALVTWNDPDDFYKQKVEYVEDREGIARYGIQQVELTAFGCSSQGQAQRAGRWALATSRLETEGITFDVGMDGAIALPGQVVRIADPSRMGRRVGGRVHAVSGRVVTLDKAPVINIGDQLTVVLPTGVSETHGVASVSGDSVTVDADWTTVPVPQSAWSVDSSELMAPLYRVLSVTEKDEVTFTITAVQHEPGKYDFVENGTVITPRTQTSLDVTKQAAPTSVTLVGYTVSLNDVQKLALQVSCAPVPGAVAYEGAYRRGNDNWVAIPRQASPTMDVLDVLEGTYSAKMAAVNSVGIMSVDTMSVAVAIAKDGASKNAAVALSSDAPYFHTNQAGTTTPAVITLTADLIALEGPVDWSCVGGTLTNKTATTAQLAFTDAASASVTVTASVTAFGRSYSKNLTVGKVVDGAAGTDGLKTGVARLYQWSATTPAKPAGTSTFTWASLANGSYSGADGWSVAVPANPGTPGLRLYIASVPLSAAAAVTTTSVSYASAAVEAWSQNGANGANAIQAAAPTVYRWDTSVPGGPSGAVSYRWSDGVFGPTPLGSSSVAPTNWSLTPGTAPSPGYTLYAAKVALTDSAANSATAFNWTVASISAIGQAPYAGSSYVTAYCASASTSATSAPAATTGQTSLPATNSGGITGTWSATVPSLTSSQYLYQVDGIYNPANNTVTWSIPYWSSLKVGSLSAISANLGTITSGSININNGTASIDSAGGAIFRSIQIIDANGIVQLSSGASVTGTIPTNIANAATTATWTGVTNRPQDVQNLVLRTSFDDGSSGNWKDGSAGSLSVVSVSGQSFSKALQINSRDSYEYFNSFPVVPGETLYVEAWLDASTCNSNIGFGVRVDNAAGSTINWYYGVALTQGIGWTRLTGSITVPAGAATGLPWFQINNTSNFGTARGAGFKVSRFQSGATVGANASNFTGTMGGDNLLNNSSFEVQSTQPVNRPNGYTAYNNAGISATYMRVVGRTGGLAFGLRANAAGASTFGLYSSNALVDDDGTIGGVQGGWQPNKTYVISFKAKKVNGSGFSLPTLQWTTGPITTTWVTRPNLSTSWQTYTVRITWGSNVPGVAGAGGHVGDLYIDCNNGTVTTNDEFHIDELIVQEGDVYSEWFPSAREAKAAADIALKTTFSPIVTYDFNGTAQGWYGENSTTVTANANSITVTANNNDPNLAVDNLSISGAKYDKIRARIRRLAGSGWDGYLFYANANHGESGSYYKFVAQDPTAGLSNAWVVVEWDMSTSINPSDWASGTVTHLRLDFGNSSADIFEIDWIAIGRYSIGSDEINAALSAIADDNVLSKGEKSAVIKEWNAIVAEVAPLDMQADALGVSRTAFDTAGSALGTYLAGLSPAWNDTTQDTTIVATTFRSKFSDYYAAKQALINSIAAKAATLSTWSGVSGAGKPADNATADVVLVARGSCSVSGNLVGKGGGTAAWDSDVYSKDSFTGGAYASAVPGDTSSRVMFGLNSDPTTDSSYASIDYGIYLNGLGGTWPNSLEVYENGASRGSFGTFLTTDIFAVVYDGSSVKYLKNGGVFYTSSASSASTPNQVLYFDSSLFDVGSTLKNIRFGPLSSNNWNNVGGTGKPADYATVSGADAATSLGFNPQFSNWTGTYPSGWGSWTGPAPVKETSTVRTPPYAVKYTVSGDTGALASVVFATPLPAGTFVQGAYDINIITNNGGGSPGYLIRLYTNSAQTVYTDTLVPVPDKTVTGWQRVPFSARVGSGQQIWGITIYQMAAYSAMPGGAWANGSVCVFDNLVFDFADSSTDNTQQKWSDVGGTGKPADNATVGATIGTNLSGQMTAANISTYVAASAIGTALIADAAIQSAKIADLAVTSAKITDLRTTNYAEDGSGNATAGAKLASTGTSLKVANNAFQIGNATFSDYWFRLVQGIDGSIANGKVIWRGNNDSTTRGGAPNIGCLSITPIASQVLNSNFQQIYHSFTLTPTSYTAFSDNLDAMSQVHVQLFASTSASTPFVQFYWPCPSRTYDGASGIAQGSWSWGWRFSGSGALPGVSQQYETNGVFTGVMRVRLANSYGWSATQDFAAGSANGTALGYTTITGSSGSSGGGSGTAGGACPAPWVKVRLANGTDVNAGDLHDGARVMAVNDSTMQPIPGGAILRDVQTIWGERYRVKLADGRATEWSKNHRFAVVDRGWVHVQNLRAGDHIMGLDECVVESVIMVGEGQVVSYRVEGAGTYFAGGMLCHNLKMLP